MLRKMSVCGDMGSVCLHGALWVDEELETWPKPIPKHFEHQVTKKVGKPACSGCIPLYLPVRYVLHCTDEAQ